MMPTSSTLCITSHKTQDSSKFFKYIDSIGHMLTVCYLLTLG
jgi:hypothetical protein